MTSTGKVLGTLQWMAPEYLKGKAYTLKADIYSYGTVMWELSSRQTPFAEANGNLALITQWVCEDGQRNKIPADTPEKLADLMRRCWAQEPDVRPDADTVIAELKKEPLQTTLLSKPTYHLELESAPQNSEKLDVNTSQRLRS